MCDDIYTQYVTYVKQINLTKDLSNFKNVSDYTYVLEHVSSSLGQEYLKLILKHTNLSTDDIIELSKINDSIGNPVKTTYDNNIIVSPSSLRYIWQAHIILTYFKKFKNEIECVEIGGGYGGLCLTISNMAARYGIIIKSYTIIDLLDIIRLQEEYLRRHILNFPVFFQDATTYGEFIDNKELYLISNYCFSEISDYHQKKYIEVLFPKVKHGFLAWNFIPIYNFGFDLEICEEIPLTGGENNKYVFF
jgi:hypothetical protein